MGEEKEIGERGKNIHKEGKDNNHCFPYFPMSMGGTQGRTYDQMMPRGGLRLDARQRKNHAGKERKKPKPAEPDSAGRGQYNQQTKTSERLDVRPNSKNPLAVKRVWAVNSGWLKKSSKPATQNRGRKEIRFLPMALLGPWPVDKKTGKSNTHLGSGGARFLIPTGGKIATMGRAPPKKLSGWARKRTRKGREAHPFLSHPRKEEVEEIFRGRKHFS